MSLIILIKKKGELNFCLFVCAVCIWRYFEKQMVSILCHCVLSNKSNSVPTPLVVFLFKHFCLPISSYNKGFTVFQLRLREQEKDV